MYFRYRIYKPEMVIAAQLIYLFQRKMVFLECLYLDKERFFVNLVFNVMLLFTFTLFMTHAVGFFWVL